MFVGLCHSVNKQILYKCLNQSVKINQVDQANIGEYDERGGQVTQGNKALYTPNPV